MGTFTAFEFIAWLVSIALVICVFAMTFNLVSIKRELRDINRKLTRATSEITEE